MFLFFSALIYLAFQFLQINLLAPFVPYLIHDLGYTAAQVGFLSSAYFWGNFIFLLPAGFLLDRKGVKQSFSFALLLLFLGVFLPLLFGISLDVLFLSRFIVGLSGAFSFIVCLKVAHSAFNAKNLSFLTGFVYFSAMFGSILGQAPYSLLAKEFGLIGVIQINFLIFCVIALIIVGATYGCKKTFEASVLESPIRDFFSIISNKQSWLVIIFNSFLNVPMFILASTWGVSYISSNFNLSLFESSLISSLFFLAVAISSPIVGFLSESILNRKSLMIIGSFLSLCVLIFIFCFNIKSLALFAISYFILGAFTSVQLLGYPQVISVNREDLVGLSSSFLSIMAMFVLAVSQPVYDYLKEFSMGDMFVVILVLLSLVSVFFIRKVD